MLDAPTTSVVGASASDNKFAATDVARSGRSAFMSAREARRASGALSPPCHYTPPCPRDSHTSSTYVQFPSYLREEWRGVACRLPSKSSIAGRRVKWPVYK